MAQRLTYFCDGAIDPAAGRTGVAVVVRDPCGRILDTASLRLGPMTNNEAEYAALILALQLAMHRRDAEPLLFLSDSRNLVGQVAGVYAVREPRLAGRRGQVLTLLGQLPGATLAFVPRDWNAVADALAAEACAGLSLVDVAGCATPAR